jgi:hypothetical protein
VGNGLRDRDEHRTGRSEPVAWVKVSIFATALLAATIAAMWASSYSSRTAGVARQTVSDTNNK